MKLTGYTSFDHLKCKWKPSKSVRRALQLQAWLTNGICLLQGIVICDNKSPVTEKLKDLPYYCRLQWFVPPIKRSIPIKALNSRWRVYILYNTDNEKNRKIQHLLRHNWLIRYIVYSLLQKADAGNLPFYSGIPYGKKTKTQSLLLRDGSVQGERCAGSSSSLYWINVISQLHKVKI